MVKRKFVNILDENERRYIYIYFYNRLDTEKREKEGGLPCDTIIIFFS